MSQSKVPGTEKFYRDQVGVQHSSSESLDEFLKAIKIILVYIKNIFFIFTILVLLMSELIWN